MNVLGIDPSTKTGLALVSATGDCLTKLLDFRKEKGCRRLQLIALGVRNMVEEQNPDAIYLEGYAYGNKHTLVCMVEVGTAIRMALYGLGRTWVEVAPTSLKKFVTGNGSAKKDLMAKKIKERWGFASESDDILDGYALAQFGLCHLQQKSPEPGVGEVSCP